MSLYPRLLLAVLALLFMPVTGHAQTLVASCVGASAVLGTARAGDFTPVAAISQLGQAHAYDEDASRSLFAAEEILPTPVVQSTKLQNIVNNLYKGTTNPLRVGDGAIMSAIRSELETGQQTNGAWHLTKGANEYQGLTNWLARNPIGAYSDRLVAQSLADELEAAFRSAGGFPW